MTDLAAYVRQVEEFAGTAPAGYALPDVTLREYYADHPGHPLGVGAPSGSSLREDGQSHRAAWASILRRDPCAYCGAPSSSVDHIVPQNPLVPAPLGGKHGWLNYVGACQPCNGRKRSVSLLRFLAAARNFPGATLK